MLVADAKGTDIAVLALGPYTVAWTDRMDENRAVPFARPFDVGCTVAAPEVTFAEPYHEDMFSGCVGTPAVAAYELEPA